MFVHNDNFYAKTCAAEFTVITLFVWHSEAGAVINRMLFVFLEFEAAL